MAASMRESSLDLNSILQGFSSSTRTSDTFLSADQKLAQTFTGLAKSLYDYSQQELKETNQGQLTELIIDNFDDEQIWQEIELQNDSCISDLVQKVARVVAAKSHIDLQEDNDEDEQEANDFDEGDWDEENEEEEGDDDDEEEEEEEYDASQDLFPELSSKDKKREEELSDSEMDNLDWEWDIEEKPKRKFERKTLKRKGPSVVDDKFFKLADMEEFLEMEDAREEKRRKKEERDEHESDSEDDFDDDEIDMFQDIPTESEEEEEDDDEEGDIDDSKHARYMKYNDFFDEPEYAEQSNKPSQTKKKMVQFDVEENDDEEDDDDDNDLLDDETEKRDDDFDNDNNGGNMETGDFERSHDVQTKDLFANSDSEGEDLNDIIGGKKQGLKSTFEKRQDKLLEKINQLEASNLSAKPWQLSGETSASRRPDNSLLQEYVDFDQTSRPAPVITEETTLTLEETIKRRIKDEAWDDVERKVKPKEEAFEYRKRVTLDQEKSKLSLAEVYEKEYLKQAKQLTEQEENKEHGEIKKMMDSLFLKLDALSNFHYTPKPAIPEVKIVSNMPSIAMEEVAPVSVSDAALLAPEEVKEKNKGGEMKGDMERTETDKKRDRRKKKKNQKSRRKEKEQRSKVVEKMNPGLGNKYSKKAALEKLEKQSKSDGRTTIIKDGPGTAKKSLSTSKAFFTKLQEEVTSEIKDIKAKKKQKKNKNTVTSSKLKL
ncbi:U3 small nucleolar ribonucleoprotein MPP10-like [Glandiceps talaboti]